MDLQESAYVLGDACDFLVVLVFGFWVMTRLRGYLAGANQLIWLEVVQAMIR